MDNQPPSPALDIGESQIFADQSASGEVGRRPDGSSRGRRPSPAPQGAYQIRVPPALRRVRSHAGRPAPSSFCPAPRARTKGQRRIHGPRLSHAHRELHRYGVVVGGVKLDPVPIALGLWQRTRPDRGWNQRPERCKPRTRGKYSSLVQCGRAIHRLKHQREAERQRLSSFCRRGPLDGFKADPPS